MTNCGICISTSDTAVGVDQIHINPVLRMEIIYFGKLYSNSMEDCFSGLLRVH